MLEYLVDNVTSQKVQYRPTRKKQLLTKTLEEKDHLRVYNDKGNKFETQTFILGLRKKKKTYLWVLNQKQRGKKYPIMTYTSSQDRVTETGFILPPEKKAKSMKEWFSTGNEGQRLLNERKRMK